MNRVEKFFRKLKNKVYREEFISARVATAIAAQIRALRRKANWDQGELARHAGMKQARVSLLESGNYENFSFKTLRRLASAFGVAVRIDFVSFPSFLNWSESFKSEEILAPESLAESLVQNSREVSFPLIEDVSSQETNNDVGKLLNDALRAYEQQAASKKFSDLLAAQQNRRPAKLDTLLN